MSRNTLNHSKYFPSGIYPTFPHQYYGRRDFLHAKFYNAPRALLKTKELHDLPRLQDSRTRC